jgi:DNA anti-recombination protein RmuC
MIVTVTAKLSRKFYETFGDEITNELVDWFNQVDLAYRGELRELNEHNFQRFDAKLEQRWAQLDAKLEQRWAQLDAKLDQRVGQLDAKLEQRTAQLDAKLDQCVAQLDAKVEQRTAELRAEIKTGLANQRAELIKWMFLFWAGTIVPLGGLILALNR